MTTLGVYLIFHGTCEAALNFYAAALGGEVVSLPRLGEIMPDADEAIKNRVINGVLKAGEITLMASDTYMETPVPFGDNVNIILNFTDRDALTKAFTALSEGGTVTMPLQDTPLNATFGSLTDKFGTPWMMSFEKPAVV